MSTIDVAPRPRDVGPSPVPGGPVAARTALDDGAHHDGSAARVLRLLDAFVGAPTLVGLSHLAERSELPKSTTHRLLATLTRAGYVRRVGDSYSLTNRVFEVGNSVMSARPNGLRECAMPYLVDLFVQTHQAVHLAILQDDEVLYLEKIFGHSAVRVGTAVGRRRPAHATALGKAIVAFSSTEVRDRVLSRELRPYTSRTTVDPARIERQLDEIRVAGFATDRGEYADRLSCVAAPVRDSSGGAMAAVSVSVPSGPDLVRTYSRQVLQTATVLSHLLGRAAG